MDRQHLIRHADQSYVFSTALFKNNFNQPYKSTFGFAPTHKTAHSQNQMCHFLALAPTEICIWVNYILTIN